MISKNAFKRWGVAALAALLSSGASWAQSGTTFSYTGTEATYTVPAGVSLVEISALGGGGAGASSRGGHGAAVTAVVAVTPGDVLKVRVGGGGVGGHTGGSATAVVTNTGEALVVAGGGGSSAALGNYPGGNGGQIGGNGASQYTGRQGLGGNGTTGTGGAGGAQCCGGFAGSGGNATTTGGTAGGYIDIREPGGASEFFGRTVTAWIGGGGAGFGGGGSGYNSGGGGYGGGGAAGDSTASGGGGGSYANTATGFTATFSVGSNGGPASSPYAGGDGSVTITPYTPPNSAPTASSVGMSGTARQGSLLTGTYTYADADNDPEGTSTFRWVRNSVNNGVAGGANVAASQTYTAVADDVGNYLYFCVTPVASANVLTGTEVCSSASAQVQQPLPVDGTCGSAAGQSFTLTPTSNLCSTGTAGSVTFSAGVYSWTCQGTDGGNSSGICTANFPNSAPTASSVGMSGTARQGSLLTGTYTYADADNDPEGTSTFRWVRNSVNNGVAGGANVAASQTYTAVADDVGNYLYFCVTPVASANVLTGTEVCSSASAQVQQPLPVDGTCGSAAGQSFTLTPTSNLCSTGTAGSVTSSAGLYSWTCQGTDGGNSSGICTANWAPTGGAGNASVTAPAPVSNNNWVLDNASVSVTAPATPPNGVTFPAGTVSLQLTTGEPGSSATVTIQYSEPIPVGAVYMKYGKSPDGYNCSGAACAVDHWYQMPANQAVFSQDRKSVTLTIQDGGVGDNDLTANSSISDPGGPAVIVSDPQAIPTLSEWAMVLMSLLMASWGVSCIRRRTN